MTDATSTDYAISPRGVPQIVIRPQGSAYAPSTPTAAGVGAAPDALGGWAPWSPPQQTAPAPAAPAQPQANGGWDAWTPPQQPAQAPIGPLEAAGRGAIDAATFGSAPVISGLSAASGMQYGDVPDEPSIAGLGQAFLNAGKAIASPVVGAAKLAANAVSSQPDQSLVDAYNQARQQALDEQNQARQQYPKTYLAGELGGGLAAPVIGGLGAASSIGRVLKSARAGAIGGGLFGGGTAASEGGSAGDIAKGAAGGTLAGSLLGGAAGGVIETGARVAGRVGSVIRGQRDPEAEAARVVREGFAQNPQAVLDRVQDRPAIAAAEEAGTPINLADLSGEPGQARLRSAANISPGARETINETIQPRFEQQSERIAGWLRSRYGAYATDLDREALQLAARKQNAPAYKRAYAAGDRPIWSPKLEQLTSSPTVAGVLRGAIDRWKDFQVLDGFGAMNPPVRVTADGQLQFLPGKGLRPYPNVQLWDYAQRILSGMAAKASGDRDKTNAYLYGGLADQLKAELDYIVPEFKAARTTAATFFKAENDLEAGRNFVVDNSISDPGAARMIGKMNPANRALFARGFATRLADELERQGYNRNVLNSIFVNSPRATRRIQIALGPDGANQFEALMRIEEVVDRTRRALGNSTTVRQANESHLAAGAGAAGILESMHGALNPVYLVAGAFILGGRAAARRIDENVAQHVARMLVSDDPAVLERGYQTVARNPVMRDALRRASDVGVRELINYARPSGVGAGAMTLYHELRSGVPETHPGPPADDQYQYEQTGDRVQ
jgi:hypothetical protein